MYNPDSGLKVYRNIPATVVSCYAERGYDVVVHYLRFTREDAEVLAEFAAMVDHVLISGGDGTVNYVVNMIVGDGYDLPVGILPGGTANDFARAIGMPAYISRACYRVLDGTPHPIDVGRAGDVCFVNVFSMGLYTDTSHKVPTRAKNMFGGLAYYAMGVAETLEFRKMRLKVTAENLDYEGEVLMLFVLNGHAAKTWLHAISLGGIHLVLSICTCQLYGWLYLQKICYDVAGAAIFLGITILSAGVVSILWLVSIALFCIRNRKKAKVD